jgi:hypothetical protein
VSSLPVPCVGSCIFALGTDTFCRCDVWELRRVTLVERLCNGRWRIFSRPVWESAGVGLSLTALLSGYVVRGGGFVVRRAHA